MKIKIDFQKSCYRPLGEAQTFEDLLSLIKGTLKSRLSEPFCLKYLDSDGDLIVIEDESSFQSARLYYKDEKLNCLKFFVSPDESFNDANSSSKMEASVSQDYKPHSSHRSEELKCRPKIPQIDNSRRMTEPNAIFPKSLLTAKFARGNTESMYARTKTIEEIENETEFNCYYCTTQINKVFYISTKHPVGIICERCEEKSQEDFLVKYSTSNYEAIFESSLMANATPHKEVLKKLFSSKSFSKTDTTRDVIGDFEGCGLNISGSLDLNQSLIFRRKPERPKMCYSAKVEYILPEEIVVAPTKSFTVKVGILNNSKTYTWPEGLTLCCYDGILKGVEEPVKAAKPNEFIEVELPLQATAHKGANKSVWRLTYKDYESDEKGVIDQFGPRIEIEYLVKGCIASDKL